MNSLHRRLPRALSSLATVALILGGLATLSTTTAGAVGRDDAVSTISGASAGHLKAHVTSLLLECEADGATISTAVAAYHAQNPTLTVSKARLLSRLDGGPFLQSWAENEPFYAYSVSAKGRLEIQIPDNGTKFVFVGPSSCQRLKSVTLANQQVVDACAADGATLSTAIAAFRAQNPRVRVNKARLLSSRYGGPYLTGWAHNPPHYAYRVTAAGALELSIPANRDWFRYRGPDSCGALI
jgi:hypothetical protein